MEILDPRLVTSVEGDRINSCVNHVTRVEASYDLRGVQGGEDALKLVLVFNVAAGVLVDDGLHAEAEGKIGNGINQVDHRLEVHDVEALPRLPASSRGDALRRDAVDDEKLLAANRRQQFQCRHDGRNNG